MLEVHAPREGQCGINIQANRSPTAIELLDRCLAKAAQDYLNDKPIDTKSLSALAGAVNQIALYARYRDEKATLHSLMGFSSTLTSGAEPKPTPEPTGTTHPEPDDSMARTLERNDALAKEIADRVRGSRDAGIC